MKFKFDHTKESFCEAIGVKEAIKDIVSLKNKYRAVFGKSSEQDSFSKTVEKIVAATGKFEEKEITAMLFTVFELQGILDAAHILLHKLERDFKEDSELVESMLKAIHDGDNGWTEKESEIKYKKKQNG